ncbi:MAG: hypothetical protein E7165_04365 [Firmicutes bacterium]|nr:hypothetical protein [Bacillota bacterium]
MEEKEFYNNNLDVNAAIHKGMEVFSVIANAALKIDEKILTVEDKKVLCLLLGIEYTNNSISKRLKNFFWSYRVFVYTPDLERDKCIEIYDKNFIELIEHFELRENFSLEELMLKLLDLEFIISLHEINNCSIKKLKKFLNKSSDSKQKIKTLQK